MTGITIVQVFSGATQGQELTSNLQRYLSSVSKIPAREVLDFRLSTDPFGSFIEYFRESICQARILSSESNSNWLDIDASLQLLLLLSGDYDFSFQFGDYGGHALLKQSQRLQGTLPVAIGNLIDEVIGTILESGAQFPLTASTSHKESVVKPLQFDFRVQPVIMSSLRSKMTQPSASAQLSSQMDDSIRVFVRQVPAGMHGAGQAAVGYVMWSSAVILSRW